MKSAAFSGIRWNDSEDISEKALQCGAALFGTSSALMMTLDVALGACVSEGEKWDKKSGFKKPTGDWEANGHFMMA